MPGRTKQGTGTTEQVFAGATELLPAHPSTIGEPKKRHRIIVTFEPHFRRWTVKRMLSLVDMFHSSIGEPQAATNEAELKGFLTDTYRRSALNPETRNFATAVSLLQDFLRPHWSQLSQQKLSGIRERLGWLDSQTDLTPRTLERFYVELASVIGSGISLGLDPDEDESHEEAE